MIPVFVCEIVSFSLKINQKIQMQLKVEIMENNEFEFWIEESNLNKQENTAENLEKRRKNEKIGKMKNVNSISFITFIHVNFVEIWK